MNKFHNHQRILENEVIIWDKNNNQKQVTNINIKKRGKKDFLSTQQKEHKIWENRALDVPERYVIFILVP